MGEEGTDFDDEDEEEEDEDEEQENNHSNKTTKSSKDRTATSKKSKEEKQTMKLKQLNRFIEGLTDYTQLGSLYDRNSLNNMGAVITQPLIKYLIHALDDLLKDAVVSYRIVLGSGE